MNEIQGFQQFVNEAWANRAKSNRHRETIKLEELNFIVDGVIYVTYETICDVEFDVEPADPSVGIFGESFEITDLTITDLTGLVKFSEEHNSELIGFRTISLSLGIVGKQLEKVLYEYVDKYLSDEENVLAEEKINVIDKLNKLGDEQRIVLFDGSDFERLVQKAVDNIDTSPDDEPDYDEDYDRDDY